MAAYVGEYLQRNEHLKSLVADAIPDFLSFAFSSLEAVKAAYGANSQQTRVALHLIDAAAAQLSAAVSDLYDNAVASVLLGVAAKARLTLPKATLQKLIDSPIVILVRSELGLLRRLRLTTLLRSLPWRRSCRTCTCSTPRP